MQNNSYYVNVKAGSVQLMSKEIIYNKTTVQQRGLLDVGMHKIHIWPM